MKSWLESLLIALSMYSAIPVKCLNWTEKNLRNAMVFFPLVGLLCGVGLWLVWLACGLLHVSSVLFGVLAVASGVLITGGIHPDGFCDTADALYSRRPQEEKLRILKDPNCGPFAVFSVILVLLVSFGSYVQLYQTQGRNVVWLLAGGILSPDVVFMFSPEQAARPRDITPARAKKIIFFMFMSDCSFSKKVLKNRVNSRWIRAFLQWSGSQNPPDRSETDSLLSSPPPQCRIWRFFRP